MDAQNKKPQYISYVRYAKKDEPEQVKPKTDSVGTNMLAYMLVGYSFFLLLTPAWMIGLPIAGTFATVKVVHKIIDYKNQQTQLVINYS